MRCCNRRWVLLSEVPLNLRPIGVIHTPYMSRADIPRQGRLSSEICQIEVYPQYSAGLKDIDQCTHLFVLFWLHLADRSLLTARPPHDRREHGVFATRSPSRPNPIALDIVELLQVDENRLKVRGMDALDGSILLDLKPYSAKIDSFPQAAIGWQRDGPGEAGEGRRSGGDPVS
ncbi:MAG: tRNA (N6-threonylcarbamoyladenosine(37)-N6)-methyltransferase TrmO [Methanosarcinales archaeon]|nr:tRNA (N6-threonylcarbamoyladenosine(37)-N6)-methyltransferase TrmO [Methanosarcinales archaeon]